MVMTLDEANRLSLEAFAAQFGDIAEHSPWVAEKAGVDRPFNDRASMIEAFAKVIENAGFEKQIALVRAHPDLATKAKLTDDSAREQAGVGLDSLSPEEFARFTELNERYKARFGFPFIFAVKGATKLQILESFEDRISNDRPTEFAMALMMVKRIVSFRLEDRVVQ